jgi:hypothetical protein
MQADPELSRTVVVTTKVRSGRPAKVPQCRLLTIKDVSAVVSVQFDTKLPQFGTSDDLEDFLRAPLIQKLYPQLLGGPFYTSVPCGRVGIGKDSVFISNEVSPTAREHGAEAWRRV